MKLLLSLLALVAGGALAADGTLAALDRPAERARAPERAVLLSAAAADARWVVVGERGLVLRSDDSGKTWQQSPAPSRSPPCASRMRATASPSATAARCS